MRTYTPTSTLTYLEIYASSLCRRSAPPFQTYPGDTLTLRCANYTLRGASASETSPTGKSGKRNVLRIATWDTPMSHESKSQMSSCDFSFITLDVYRTSNTMHGRTDATAQTPKGTLWRPAAATDNATLCFPFSVLLITARVFSSNARKDLF